MRFKSLLNWMNGKSTKSNSSNDFPRRDGDVKIILEENGFILRQLFHYESCTYTYLLGDLKSREAILIDPVFELAGRDKELVQQLRLNLRFVLNTHVHADHITGSGLLKKLYGHSLQSIISLRSGADADLKVDHGDLIFFGNYSLEVRYTPGHTNGCLCFVFHFGKIVFTGDSLLIRGCGRTDFQGGCPIKMYNSIHTQIFSLPEEYTVYPAHDYKGRTCSTIGEEKRFNKRLNKTLDEFILMMEDFARQHKRPGLLDIAVPANRVCGLWNLPPEMEEKLQSVGK